MNRNKFLSLLGLSSFTFFNKKVMAQEPVKLETHLFKDDGIIPNSKYPLLHYQKAFTAVGATGATWLEQHFAKNNWTNSWRNGVYPFHHYHSTSHEVLGIYSGSAMLFLGGEKGEKIRVEAGDIVMVPAGVGHKNLGNQPNITSLRVLFWLRRLHRSLNQPQKQLSHQKIALHWLRVH